MIVIHSKYIIVCYNPFKILYNWLYRIIIYTFFCKIICKTCNISALLTAYSQSKRNQINPLPSLPPSAFAQTPYPHSITFISMPTPMFAKVYPNPPPKLQPPPPVCLPFSTETGEGVYSVVQVTLPPTFFTPPLLLLQPPPPPSLPLLKLTPHLSFTPLPTFCVTHGGGG